MIVFSMAVWKVMLLTKKIFLANLDGISAAVEAAPKGRAN
jgi:hypothetical protein